MTEVSIELLLRAYSCGIFPMADSRDPGELYWVEPKIRGILPLERFHLPRSLRRTIKKQPFRVTVDRAFSRVIRLCGAPEAGRADTWINEEIVRVYCELFAQGHAHSIECWRGDRLAGGLYGVEIGAAFFGESMFHLESEASKVALAYTVARLKAGGYTLFDVQFVSEHLKRFGVAGVAKETYLMALQDALKRKANFYRLPDEPSAEEVLQLIAHTS